MTDQFTIVDVLREPKLAQLTPDDLCAMRARDVADSEARLDAAYEVWPAAYGAIRMLEHDVADGRVSPATAAISWDLPLFDFVREAAG